jgi:hypothetical protein
MPDQSPGNLRILQLIHANLTGKRTIGLIEDVLRGDTDLGVCEAAGEKEVDGWRGDDDLSVWIEFGGVEVGDDVGGGLGGSVPGREGSVILLVYLGGEVEGSSR